MDNASNQPGRQKLLIVNRQQFGYHIDTFYYCKYLRERLDIKYVGWDYTKPRVSIRGVAVEYVSRHGNKVVRYLRFLLTIFRALKAFEGIAFLKYFPGCSLMRALRPKVRFVVDIRSGSVASSGLVRLAEDAILALEIRCFNRKTVISRALANRLRLRDASARIVPLGADVISSGNKTFDDLRLVYVGALGRRIEDTVTGLKDFLSNEGKNIRCTYKIIGYGFKGEEGQLGKLCRELGLDDVVEVLGYVPHEQLGQYFDQCNVGVAYIPITSYYDVQPPTKLFEYLLSGMPAIATATAENKRIVRRCNGVLIDSTAAGFRAGLTEIHGRRHEFDSRQIRQSVAGWRWSEIIEGNLLPYLQTL